MYYESTENPGLYVWKSINNILEYNQIEEEWTEIGAMKEARANHGVAIVNYSDYEKYCLD